MHEVPVYVYICMYYIHMCICMKYLCKYIYMYVLYICMYICRKYLCMYIYVCIMYICRYMSMKYLWMYIYVGIIYIDMDVCMHKVPVYVNIYIDVCIIYIHMHDIHLSLFFCCPQFCRQLNSDMSLKEPFSLPYSGAHSSIHLEALLLTGPSKTSHHPS